MAKKVSTRAIEDLEYEHELADGEMVSFRLRADCPGIVRWLQPDDEGRIAGPEESNMDEFIALVIEPADGPRFADLLEADRLGEAVRYDMARTAWANSRGVTDYVSVLQRIKSLAEKAVDLEVRLDEEEQRLAAMANGQQPDEEEADEDAEVPFGDATG